VRCFSHTFLSNYTSSFSSSFLSLQFTTSSSFLTLSPSQSGTLKSTRISGEVPCGHSQGCSECKCISLCFFYFYKSKIWSFPTKVVTLFTLTNTLYCKNTPNSTSARPYPLAHGCDPMWQVSSRSSVATLRTAIHLLLTYLPQSMNDVL